MNKKLKYLESVKGKIMDYDPAYVYQEGFPLCSKCNNVLPRFLPNLEKYDAIEVDGTTLELTFLVPCVICGERHNYIYCSNIDEELMFVESR